MRIKNESKRIFIFNGGSVAPYRVADIKDRKVAEALLKCYPNDLVCLDNIKVDTVVEDKAKLVEKAKELGVRGNVEGMKVETLKAKIASFAE